MGAMQNNEQKTSGKNSRRGSQNNKRRLDAFAKVGGKGEADWGGCYPEKLQGVVQAITAVGGAVTFGLSRDEGAHMLTLLLDDSKETLWFNGDANLNDELDAVAATLAALE